MNGSPQWLRALVVSALSFQLAACGTILHPERKGQRDGRLDAGIVVLDAIGLLFFIIPGVIAFAVDFSNGTIYLPGGRRASFDPKTKTPETLKAVILKETGYSLDWRDERLRVVALKDKREIPWSLARAARPSGRYWRMLRTAAS